MRDVVPAARAIGLQIEVFKASTSRGIDAAFATFVRERHDAVLRRYRSIFSQSARPFGQPDAPAEKGKGQVQQGKDAPAEKGKAQQGAGGTSTMTAEQRTTIRETVISKGPRVTNVNFSVSVGTVVPRTVTLVVLPVAFVEIYPQYRGRRYFVYNEQIIVVDDDFKIIAIITV